MRHLPVGLTATARCDESYLRGRDAPGVIGWVRCLAVMEGRCIMAAPRPRPALAVIREGNPSRKPVKEGLKLPPSEVVEPDWAEVLPAGDDDSEVARLRAVATREWNRIVPVLKVSAGLGVVDMTVLTDYCVCVARIDQGERSLTRDGVLMAGERGMQKSGWTTIVGQYRTQLRAYIVELGLSPSARMKIGAPKDDDDADSDPFD